MSGTLLPALRSEWPGTTSLFAGIALDANGQPYALLLAAVLQRFTPHYAAENLAIDHGALLPTRLDGALIHASQLLADLELPKDMFGFWLAERAEPTFGHPNAWAQTLSSGCQWFTHVGTERTTVLLVQRMPLLDLGFSLSTGAST